MGNDLGVSIILAFLHPPSLIRVIPHVVLGLDPGNMSGKNGFDVDGAQDMSNARLATVGQHS